MKLMNISRNETADKGAKYGTQHGRHSHTPIYKSEMHEQIKNPLAPVCEISWNILEIISSKQ